MAGVANTLRYRLGQVNVTNNGTTVTGVGTHWTTAGINPGATFRLDGLPFNLEVKRVVSDTEIELVKPYYGTTAAGLSYSVERNFNSTLPAKLASDVAELVGIYEQIRDGVYLTIEGKSAYQLAVADGFTGTVSQWLESLKGAGEYVVLREELEAYRQNTAGTHNAHYYEKNIGPALTEVQSSAIRNGTFESLYPGCYWNITYPAYSWKDEDGVTHDEASDTATFRVAGCDTKYYVGNEGERGLETHHLEVISAGSLFNAPMNDTNTTDNAYLGSKMVTNYLRRAEAIVKAAFGEDHILPHREFLNNAVTDGRPSGGTWVTRLVDLMSERMVYGSNIYSVASEGEAHLATLYTSSKSQLPIFRHAPRLMNNKQWFWLRDVVNADSFANVTGHGAAGWHKASASGGVRISFLVY